MDAMESMIVCLSDGSATSLDLITSGALPSLNGLIQGGLTGEKDVSLSISAVEVVATILSSPEVQSPNVDPSLLRIIQRDLENMAPSIYMALEEHVRFLEQCVTRKSVLTSSRESVLDTATPPAWLLGPAPKKSSHRFWHDDSMDLGKMAACCCIRICSLPSPAKEILRGPSSLPFIPLFAKIMRLTPQASDILRPTDSIQPDQMSLVCIFKLAYDESGPCERALKELLASGDSVQALCSAMTALSSHRSSLDIAGAILLDLTSLPDAHFFLTQDLKQALPPTGASSAADLRTSSAISSLVKTMGDTRQCPDVRMGASLALGRLAAKSRSCQMDAVREGVLPALAAMMQAAPRPLDQQEGVGWQEERAHGARLLAIVAQPTPTHGHILSKRSFTPGTILMTAGDESGDSSVLDVLVNLLHQTVAELDRPFGKGMGGLVEKLRRSSDGPSDGSITSPLPPPDHSDHHLLQSILRHSAGALAVLAHNPSTYHEILSKGAGPLLVRVLRVSADPKVQSNVLSCLMSLACNDERSAAVVVRSGAIPVVLRILEQTAVDLERQNWKRENPNLNLNLNPKEHQGAVEGSRGDAAHCIEAASRVMVGDMSTCLISSLCRYQCIQTELVQANGTEALLRLLSVLSDPVDSRWALDQAANVCEALALLASSGTPEHVVRLCVNSCQIVKNAKNLLSSPNPSVRYWTTCLLSGLCNNEPAVIEDMLGQGIQYQLVECLRMDDEIAKNEQEGMDSAMWAASQQLDGALSRVQAAWLLSKIAASDVTGGGETGAASLVRAGAIKPLVLFLGEALAAEQRKPGREGMGRIKRQRSSDGGSAFKLKRGGSRTTLSPSSAKKDLPLNMEIDGGWYRQVEEVVLKGLTHPEGSNLTAMEIGLHSNAVAACRSALLTIERCGGPEASLLIARAKAEASWLEGLI